jgi:hypothetical protein
MTEALSALAQLQIIIALFEKELKSRLQISPLLNVHTAPDLKPDAKSPICASSDLESGLQ